MLLLVVLTALAISMATTPLMMRLAPRLGMIDEPDPRKVHAVAVPRVGGIGIFAGSMIAALLWIPASPWLTAFMAGALVLFLFGAADDSMELGHYPKFVGQLVAACLVVYSGDLWVAHLPFMSHQLDPSVGKPFTVFALVGVINAINHSDGLDGLAGGEALLSLGCIACLGYLAGGNDLAMLAAAVGGGVFGFLRFNTHPAQVFMGDAGSQFLGFSLGVLAVLLTQRVDPSLSMALPALMIGLPIVDILAVLAQRIYQRMNWFRATRNHIHHRLLGLGFAHGQSVMVIYSVQLMLVASAVMLRYESDMLVVGVYLAMCLALFGLITWGERGDWKLRGHPLISAAASATEARHSDAIYRTALAFVKISVPVFLVGGVLLIDRVPGDFSVAAAGVLGLAACSLLVKSASAKRILTRIALYSGVAYLTYLLDQSRVFSGGVAAILEAGYFILLGIAVSLALRRQQAEARFRTTPLDFLLVIAVLTCSMLAATQITGGGSLAGLIVRMAILFYACELALDTGRRRESAFQEWSLIGSATVLLLKTSAFAALVTGVTAASPLVSLNN